jgi:general secretion pathway protein A
VLCDSALVYGFADELKAIDTDILENVYEELKALGTFTDYDAKPSADPLPPKSAITGSAAKDSRIEFLVGKVQLLDDKIKALKDRLDFLSDKRIKRDDIIVELLKMLLANMDSRNHLMDKLNQIADDNTTPDDNNQKGGDKTSGSSKVSSLKNHKQKMS